MGDRANIAVKNGSSRVYLYTHWNGMHLFPQTKGGSEELCLVRISGEIRIKFWDTKSERYRTAQGYIGEGGLEPNTSYKLNAKNEFVKA